MSRRTSLASYPRPNVAVDLAVLTVDPDQHRLSVLVQERQEPAGEALPGRFLREEQTIADAVAQTLALKVGVEPAPDRAAHLLRIFDEPGRDDRSWTVSAAHSLSLRYADVAGAAGRLVPISRAGGLPPGVHLLFDHDAIVAAAVAALRRRYEVRDRVVATPDPDRFATEPFTLSDLRHVHEAVLGMPLQKDNFNRRVVEQLRPVRQRGEPALRREGRGRPAQLYRHARRR